MPCLCLLSGTSNSLCLLQVLGLAIEMMISILTCKTQLLVIGVIGWCLTISFFSIFPKRSFYWGPICKSEKLQIVLCYKIL